MGSGEGGERQGGVVAQRESRMEAHDLGSQVGSGRLKERVGLSRRTRWGFGGQAQMSEDFEDHVGIFDGGDRRHRAPTLETDGHVDREDAFEQLGPAQAGLRGSRGNLALRTRGG